MVCTLFFKTGNTTKSLHTFLAGPCFTVRNPWLYHFIFLNILSIDTIYACQDKKDDVKMGIRSTALLFGSWIRPLLVSCAIMFILMLTWAGIINEQERSYFIISVGGTAVHLVWQFATVDLEEPSSCWSEYFMQNPRKQIKTTIHSQSTSNEMVISGGRCGEGSCSIMPSGSACSPASSLHRPSDLYYQAPLQGSNSSHAPYMPC